MALPPCAYSGLLLVASLPIPYSLLGGAGKILAILLTICEVLLRIAAELTLGDCRRTAAQWVSPLHTPTSHPLNQSAR